MAILGYKNSSQFIRAFGLAEWLKTRGLAGWLEIATDDLEAPARQRIAREIEAHYAEAVSAHMADGEPELSAQAMALAELGDPQVAARNFQKSHLTESEVKSMQWMGRTAAKPLFSFRMLPLDIIMPLVGFALYSHVHRILDFRFIAIFAISVLIIFVGFRLIPRLLCARALPRTSFLRGLALSGLITGVAVGLNFALIIYMQHHDVFPAAMYCCFCSFSLKRYFRIWNKLRKMSNERNDLPPQQTTAS